VSATSDIVAAGTAVVGVCRRLYERGLIAGSDGNVSVRLDDGTVLVTPSGASKADPDTANLVRVSIDGTVLCRGRPSSELRMHFGSIHAAPMCAPSFTRTCPWRPASPLRGQSFMTPVLPEVILKLGEVP
jgi:L-fuculose-phosphate aldolase